MQRPTSPGEAINAEALARHAPTPPTERQGLSLYNIVLNYGLSEFFFLGSALHHLLQAACAADPRRDLEIARGMVDVEIARDTGNEPLADEDALGWATPEVIAMAYGATGSHAAAIIQLLSICAFDIDDHVDETSGVADRPLEYLSDLIALAIDECTTSERAA